MRQSHISPHCRLMETCLQRLIRSSIPTRSSFNRGDMNNNWFFHTEILLRYAYYAWYRHARESIPHPALPESQPISTILRFLKKCTSYPALPEENETWIIGFSNHDIFTLPIHMVSFYGLAPLLPFVESAVCELTRGGSSALALAARKNDRDMIEQLL